MKFEGYNSRKLTEQKDISFLLSDSFVNNVSGDVHFGFSGEGQVIQFKFKKGKIYDPTNNYVYSYTPLNKFTLSGDISENYYNYSINGELMAEGMPKNGFKIEEIFINTTAGTEFDTSLLVYSDGIDYTFTFPDQIVIGESITGQMTNNSTDAKLEIFSATLAGTTNTNYSIDSFPSFIEAGESGDFVLNNIAGISGTHILNVDLDTNIGPIFIKDSTVASFPETRTVINKLEQYVDNAHMSLIFDETNSEGLAYYFYHPLIFSSGNIVQEATVSLEYVEGNVGTYHRVTGVTIDNPGGGYTGAPTVSFSAGSGYDVQAEGEVVMSGDGVSGVTVTNSGVYYDAPPTISFSGGGDPFLITSAQTSVITETYEKTFKECWDMYTGLTFEYLDNGNYTDGSEATYTSTATPYYINTDPFDLPSRQKLYIGIKGKSFYDFDEMKVKLKIWGTLPDTNTNQLTEEVTITSVNAIA